MTTRSAIIATQITLLTAAGCSLITDFDSWHPAQEATAGTAGLAVAGRSVGVAGNAAGKVPSNGSSGNGNAPNTAVGGAANAGVGSAFFAGASGSGVGGDGPSTSLNSAGAAAVGASGSSTQSSNGTAGMGASLGVAGNAGRISTTGGMGAVVGGAAATGTATAGSTSGGNLGGVAGAATGGNAGSSVGTSGAAGTTSTDDCPGTGGPTMVKLPQGYCIDSTEVTRAQYTAWLNTTTAATVAAQDQTACGWNQSFTPRGDCMSDASVCQGSTCSNHPQVCVDWCDAYAYCKGIGKRLCGMVGGGPNAKTDAGDSYKSEWMSACSSFGANTYPYGYYYKDTACDGLFYWQTGTPTTREVGSLSTCQAPPPYAGIYDLSGNVKEWEDSCDISSAADAFAICLSRGGSFNTGSYAGHSSCGYTYSDNRSATQPDVGFRCCS